MPATGALLVMDQALEAALLTDHPLSVAFLPVFVFHARNEAAVEQKQRRLVM